MHFRQIRAFRLEKTCGNSQQVGAEQSFVNIKKKAALTGNVRANLLHLLGNDRTYNA